MGAVLGLLGRAAITYGVPILRSAAISAAGEFGKSAGDSVGGAIASKIDSFGQPVGTGQQRLYYTALPPNASPTPQYVSNQQQFIY